MCFHEREEVTRFKKTIARALGFRQTPEVAMAEVRDENGAFVGAMPVDWKNRQAIANVMRDLRAWHPNATRMDFRDINRVRELDTKRTGRTWSDLTKYSLPPPTGEAEPYAFAGAEETWDAQLKEAAEYIHKHNQRAAGSATA